MLIERGFLSVTIVYKVLEGSAKNIQRFVADATFICFLYQPPSIIMYALTMQPVIASNKIQNKNVLNT